MWRFGEVTCLSDASVAKWRVSLENKLKFLNQSLNFNLNPKIWP